MLLDIGRRNVEGGGRNDDLRHTSFRGVVGLRGDIADGWSYDVYGLYGTSILSENFQNDFSRSRLRKALNAVTGPNGQPVCRVNADADLSNDDPNCVPYQIFGVGGVTPEQLAYLQIPGLSEGETVEQILSGSVSGDLGQYGVKLPTANDGLGVAFGAEYRSERSELRTDANYQTQRPGRPGRADARHVRPVRRQGSVRRSAPAARCRTSRSPTRCRSKRAIATRTTTSASTRTATSSVCSGRRSAT